MTDTQEKVKNQLDFEESYPRRREWQMQSPKVKKIFSFLVLNMSSGVTWAAHWVNDKF